MPFRGRGHIHARRMRRNRYNGRRRFRSGWGTSRNIYIPSND